VLVLSCSPPHAQSSWLQVKLSLRSDRPPLLIMRGCSPAVLWQSLCIALHSCAGKFDTSQQPYTRLWNLKLVLSLCPWNWSRLEAEERIADYLLDFLTLFGRGIDVISLIFTSVLGMLSCLLWYAYWTVGDLESFGFSVNECQIFKLEIVTISSHGKDKNIMCIFTV